MRIRDFDALIFDNDGVLVDSEVIHVEVERELLAEIGLHYETETYLSRFVGLSNPDFYRELANDFAERGGGKFPADFGAKLQARVWPIVKSQLQPMPGVSQLVEVFNGPVAVASSAPMSKLETKLQITGLAPLFSGHVYSADQVEHGKPAPDLFLHAALMLQVDPERCAVIEDSVNGVRAACAAGMTPIGFVGGGHADSGLADRLASSGAACVVSSHLEIAALI